MTCIFSGRHGTLDMSMFILRGRHNTLDDMSCRVANRICRAASSSANVQIDRIVGRCGAS